jgi:hypothetical protein
MNLDAYLASPEFELYRTRRCAAWPLWLQTPYAKRAART